ncbi:MAG TPA: DUF2285 domain-containing protein [Allosphingosinicella sp.]|jgi:hypothetical protein
MPSPPQAWSDWRAEGDYASLLEADRTAFAWEWLRRTHDYRREWEKARPFAGEAEREARARMWGLHRLEDPALPVPLARPLWRRELFPFVLIATAEPEGEARDRLDLSQFRGRATIHASLDGEEHLLLSDGLRSIRVDIVSGTLRGGAARLSYRLRGLLAADAPLLVLRRLLAFCRTGRFSPALHRREPRAARWIMTLRAYDALTAGASQREIAEALLSRDAALSRWRVAAPSLRSRVQRLVRTAREMGDGGYLEYLR